ncbi:melanization protease 1 [Aedes albopictus]|uniref:CLIP domain-containing serine protease n=1 Tax=Aedes albopictus TaxID=7160 RepID=A0ABM1ZGQ6_AEDAL
MKSSICVLLWCIILISRWASSQEMDDCMTKCVLIVNCPALLKIANSSEITARQQRFFTAHLCGDQKVCCEEPNPTSATTTTIPDTDYNEFRTLPLLPNENYCGLDAASERSISGGITDINQYRWTVALDYNNQKIKGVRCGGSLINRRYVLTAAHCVYWVREYELTLRLGDWDIQENPDCDMDGNCNEEAKFVNVSRIIIHPEYKRDRTGSKVNDIALLRMENALPENYTNYILPICMPTSVTLMQDLFANRNVSTVGWRLAVPETRNRYKMYSEIKTISNHKCEKELEKPISDSKMCAKPLSSKYSDVCGSDSGSPLQIQINGTYYLIGIVSYGPRCGLTPLPAVYTRVTSYMAWILENITD